MSYWYNYSYKFNKINIIFINNLHLSAVERAKYVFTITPELQQHVNSGYEIPYHAPLIVAIGYGYVAMVQRLLPLTRLTTDMKHQIQDALFHNYYTRDNYNPIDHVKILKILLSANFINWIYNESTDSTHRYYVNLLPYNYVFNSMCGDIYNIVIKGDDKRICWYLIHYKLAKILIKNYSNINYKQSAADKLNYFGYKNDIKYILRLFARKCHRNKNHHNLLRIFNYSRKYAQKYKYLYLIISIYGGRQLPRQK